MRRRDFITALGGVTVTWPLSTRAQQPAIPVIGFLHAGFADGYATEVAAFLRGLREAGYTEGQNVAIEYRWAKGSYDRLPTLADDLVRRQVAVIAAAPFAAAVAAKKATTALPIVFEQGIDPVDAGLVGSLSRPGANITGIVNLSFGLVTKRIEIMHEAMPNATLIALLINPSDANAKPQVREAKEAQTQLGIQIEVLQASTIGEIEAAFARVATLRADGLVIGLSALFTSKVDQMASLATRYRIPASDQLPEFSKSGGLMSYGSDLADAYRLMGVYSGRILNGEKPANLPVQQSTKVQMVINLKTAKALGVTFPLPLLGRADEVIE